MCKKKSQRSNQNGYPRKCQIPPWRRCCFSLCSIAIGARLMACCQVFLSLSLLVLTLFCYNGKHAADIISDIFLISIITHVCLAIICAALIFLALHFRLRWLLTFELVYLVLAMFQYLAALVIFETYALRDALKWLIGRTGCHRAGGAFVCSPLPKDEWPLFEWWNVYMAMAYLLAGILSLWFFNITLRCRIWLKEKCQNERKRRQKAVDSLGLFGDGGALVGTCGARGGAAHSRSTLTTSLATTYEPSLRDPDLLMRY